MVAKTQTQIAIKLIKINSIPPTAPLLEKMDFSLTHMKVYVLSQSNLQKVMIEALL